MTHQDDQGEEPAPGPPRRRRGTPKPERTRLTVYLSTDDDVTLRTIQVKRLSEAGVKPDLSELVAEAIRLLAEREPGAS